MGRTRLFVPIALAAIVLTGCFGSANLGTTPPAASTPAASSGGAASATPAASPSASGTSGTTEPIPSDDLEAFSCELPVVEDASVAVANIVDVRVGTHDGYDRVVFEFEGGTPELTLDRASPPFTQDASGLPLDVEGSSFLRLTMRGGTKQTDAGTSSYEGSTDFDPALPMLVDLIEGGDFERQSTWYLGLDAEACVRVLVLDEPARVVIDVEH
jgi:hypothetical protein